MNSENQKIHTKQSISPIALIDNLQLMLTFTFKNSEYHLIEREKAEISIKKVLVEQGLNCTTKHQNSLINFFIDRRMQNGTTISVNIWHNPLKKLRHYLQDKYHTKFEKGLRKRESNFISPEYVTQEEQVRNVDYAIDCIATVLSAALQAQYTIKSLFNLSILPTIKLSVLKIEGVVDIRYKQFDSSWIPQQLFGTYKEIIKKSPMYKFETVDVQQEDFMSISGYLAIVIDKHFTKKGELQYQKVGAVYFKTPTILRFEYAKNLHNGKYRKKRNNTTKNRKLKRYSIDAPTITTLETDKMEIQEYFVNHLIETQTYYTKSSSKANCYKLSQEFKIK